MALTNAQFQAIIHTYEKKQDENRHLLSSRREFVSSNVPGYDEMDASTATISIEYGKKLLDGEENATEQLHLALEEIDRKKKELLLSCNLPADYLEPVYDCPDCKDTGYINSKKCHCLRSRIVDFLYEQSNIRDMLEHENFDSLSYDYYKGDDLLRYQNAVSICHDFIDNFSTKYANLLFCGTVGCGKSFLSNCIAKELLKDGYSVIYFSAVNLFAALSEYTFENKNKESLYNPYEDLYNCDLVIIDDLGTEITNSFTTSQFFSLINERNMRKKSMIISTNLSLGELRDRYSDRIFSRITNSFTGLKISGPDIRQLKKHK